MRHDQLPSPREPKYTPVQTRWLGLKEILQTHLLELADDDPVYINGLTMRAEDIRFMLSTMKEPSS